MFYTKMQCFLLILVYFSLERPLSAMGTCKEGKHTWTYANQCLEINYQRMTLLDARKYCTDRKGHLIEIRSSRLQDSIAQYLKSNENGHHEFWINASDDVQEGWWMWNNDPRTMTYTNWNLGKVPMDFGFLFGVEAKDCAVISTRMNYTWRAVPCNGASRYNQFSVICQYTLPDSSSASTLSLTAKSTLKSTASATTSIEIDTTHSTETSTQIPISTERLHTTVSSYSSESSTILTTTTVPVMGIVIG